MNNQCNGCSTDSKTAGTGHAKLHHACFAESQTVSAGAFWLGALEAVAAYVIDRMPLQNW